MVNNRQFFVINTLLLLPTLLSLYSCKRENEFKGPSVPFIAAFTIFEPYYGSSRIFSTDTIVTYNATFEADGDYDTYTWTVGDDPSIHKTKTFSLQFPFSVSGQTINARLIATKNGQVDTMEKQFSIYAVKGTANERLTNYIVELPYLGSFEGSFDDDSTHKFVVTITSLDETSGNFNGFRIINLPEGCGAKYVPGNPCIFTNISSTNYSYPFTYTYKSFYLNSGDALGCCPPVIMYGYMENRNKITIECNFPDPVKSRFRKFMGTKR